MVQIWKYEKNGSRTTVFHRLHVCFRSSMLPLVFMFVCLFSSLLGVCISWWLIWGSWSLQFIIHKGLHASVTQGPLFTLCSSRVFFFIRRICAAQLTRFSFVSLTLIGETDTCSAPSKSTPSCTWRLWWNFKIQMPWIQSGPWEFGRY